jgi:predicted Zn-dependent protease
MNRWKRITCAITLVTMLGAAIPLQAAAVSTATEIRIGQEAARQVEAGSPMQSDPVLNNWVNSIAAKLAKYRARPDIAYKFKIVDTNDINAFSLPGGFVYVNFGLLNFVNSDDELAGVMGHEMGHVERRHQITMNAKAQVLNILLGVLSIASPFVYRFGNLIGDLSMYKMSRVDELQADQYGLLLMTRANYDPDGMVSFMYRLGKQYGFGRNGLEKYFADHPDPKARIAHLQGYPEIAKTDPSQELQQAIHDEEEGRFAYSLYKLDRVMSKSPNDQTALLHKGQVALALGNFQTSELALTQVKHVAHSATPAGAAADRELSLLPRNDDKPSLLKPNLARIQGELASADAAAKANQSAISDRVKLGKKDVKTFGERLDNLSYEVPNFGRIDIRPGSRLDAVERDLEHMSKDLNMLLDKAGFALGDAEGMLKDDAGVLNEMQAPLRAATISGSTLRLLPHYPALIKQINDSTNQLVGAVTDARGAVALGWQAVGPLDNYLRELDRTPLDFGGDISPRAGSDLKVLATAAITALDAAAAAAEQAQAQYFAAQSRQLQSRITLLGLAFPRARYDTLRHVLHQRLGVEAPSYDEALTLDLAPGDVAAASWLAAEQKVPVSTIVNEQRATGRGYVDMALDKHLSQESLEVVLGLVWEGYAEKPQM